MGYSFCSGDYLYTNRMKMRQHSRSVLAFDDHLTRSNECDDNARYTRHLNNGSILLRRETRIGLKKMTCFHIGALCFSFFVENLLLNVDSRGRRVLRPQNYSDF